MFNNISYFLSIKAFAAINPNDQITKEDLNQKLKQKMHSHKFCIEASRTLRKKLAKILEIHKDVPFKDLPEFFKASAEATMMELEEIAERSNKCDHGTIDECWSYGIVLETFKTKRGKWLLFKYGLHAKCIYSEDAKDFLMLENEFPRSG